MCGNDIAFEGYNVYTFVAGCCGVMCEVITSRSRAVRHAGLSMGGQSLSFSAGNLYKDLVWR